MAVDKQPTLEDEDTVVPLLTLEGFPVDSERDPESTGVKKGQIDDSASFRNNEPGPSKRFQKRTPLPMVQIVVLSAVRLAEPIAYTQIFPVSTVTLNDDNKLSSHILTMHFFITVY